MDLALITTYWNPYNSPTQRRNLFRFLRWAATQHLPVFAAEVAYFDQPFVLPEQPEFFRFRSDISNIMWHKENLVNIAVERLPKGYPAAAWIDPDVMFLSNGWYGRAKEALDESSVVQLFSMSSWTDENGVCESTVNSACTATDNALLQSDVGSAWAARRELWTEGGGLFEDVTSGRSQEYLSKVCIDDASLALDSDERLTEWHRTMQSWVRLQRPVVALPDEIVHEWDDTPFAGVTAIPYETPNRSRIIVQPRADGLLEFAPSIPPDDRRALSEYLMNRRLSNSPIAF